MDRTYRSIWNDKRGNFALKGLAASLILAFASNTYALPSGGVVSAGSASVSGGAGSMTINQASQNVAINWQSFSIGQTEAVRFVQPNSSAIALNRVLGSDPSSILGSLSANGKVFLVNPSGILFGQGAQVNVGALVASTRNITDSDFMAGNHRFAGTGGGTVVNQGSINADGGYVALLGASVSNDGVISARLGSVALAAGNAFTLDVAGDGLLNVAVNQGAFDALVQNGGVIRADGGQVLLSALSAGNLLQSAVNNTGVIQAQTVENRNGTIRLLGDMQSGTVSVGGTLDASGTGTGQTGGNVTVTGHHVGLFGGHINASGDAGGGTVLVGGGFQGNNPAVQNASAAYMSADSTISADAITNGNGGTAVVWSNDSTRAYGSITARGGAQGGNGGLIETSGHWLDVAGIRVNAGAPNGNAGSWLLDPANIEIIGGLVVTDATNTSGVFAPNAGANSSTIGVDAITAVLGVGGAGTDVRITTTNSGNSPGSGAGNITVSAVIAWSPTTSTTLTLEAAGDVNINQRITATGGNLVVCCGQDINVRARITTTNGSVLLTAGRDIRIERAPLQPIPSIDAEITTTDGNITLCAGRNLILSNTFNGAELITLTRGSVQLGQDLQPLGVARGLTLIGGNAATGPGPAGGTVQIGAGTVIKVTGPDPVSPINIFYNPVSYALADRTDYSGFFATGDGSPLRQFMLVYPDGANKFFSGNTLVDFGTPLSLKGAPNNVTLAGPGVGTFDNFGNALVTTPNIGITYSGFTLAGADAGLYALSGTGRCCGPAIQRTSATIFATPPQPPPPPLPPGGPVPPGIEEVLLIDDAMASPEILLPAFYPFTRLSGYDLVVEGIRMPPIVLAETPRPVPPPPVVIPREEAPPVYVPPPLPRRPDRN